MSPDETPAALGYRMPGEWEKQDATWLAWPFDAELWGPPVDEARRSFVELCRTIADGERVEVLVPEESLDEAKAALGGVDVRFSHIPFGDIWLRDIAPLFIQNREGEMATVRFKFNGWGGKYDFPGDQQTAPGIAARAGLREFVFDHFVLEGGGVDFDGEGTCLTTAQCLLNENRNPGMSKEEIEKNLKDALGAEKVLWLGDGLLNDHTDGHVDTIARFVAPGEVLCMAPNGDDDPNREILFAIIRDLESFTDAKGRKLKVHTLPSPGKILDEDDNIMPASYVNFYIANTTVAVPTYGVASDDAAVAKIAALFPDRRCVGIPAKAVLTGGGAFHCITQQQPSRGAKR